MQIIELTKEQFDGFAISHKNRSFYQTSQYGTLMNRHGFFDIYVALIDNNNQIIAASLILTKKMFANYKYGYSPRGFLIDFKDQQLLETFTTLLKQYLHKLKLIYLKVDPYVVNIERDKDGNPVENGMKNKDVVDNLTKLRYDHTGYNLYFENLKPRWNAVTKITSSSQRLFTLLDKSVRNKIRRAERKGIVVYKGNRDDIKTFYNIIDKKHTRKLNYYLDCYEIFSKKDMFDIYFAKINTETYLKNSKKLYENENKKNNDLSSLIQQNINKNSNIINNKMESDKLLSIYKDDIINATNLFKTHPEGIILATAAIIKYAKEVFFLIDGYNPKYKTFSATHLLKWKIMEEFAQKGYLYIHQNGITGDFNKTSNKFYGLNDFKIGFNADVVEYIGEFDLIINSKLYYIYNYIKPIKNVFNKAFRK